MDYNSILEKLKSESEVVVEMLDTLKSKRMRGAKSNYMRSVEEVAAAIKSIPTGQTKTRRELRRGVATIANTDTACPAKILKYWKWMANLSDESKLENSQYDIPWWRVLKDGKPSRRMPG